MHTTVHGDTTVPTPKVQNDSICSQSQTPLGSASYPGYKEQVPQNPLKMATSIMGELKLQRTSGLILTHLLGFRHPLLALLPQSFHISPGYSNSPLAPGSGLLRATAR